MQKYNFADWIGFFILLAVVLFLNIRKAQQERRRRDEPEEWEVEQQKQKQAYDQMMQTLQQELQGEVSSQAALARKERQIARGAYVEEEAPKAPKRSASQPRPRAAPVALPTPSVAASSSKKQQKRAPPSSLEELVATRQQLREAIVLRELLGPPRAFSDERQEPLR